MEGFHSIGACRAHKQKGENNLLQLVRQNLLGEPANARDIKIESRPFDFRGIIRRGL